jgi:hypothetical protein
MELFVVLFLCVVAALVIYWVVSPRVGSQRTSRDDAAPNRHSTDEPRENSAGTGTTKRVKRPF